MASEGGWHDEVPTVRVRDERECEGLVRHRSRTCVRQLKASAVRIFWRVRPALAFCPVRDALSQSASAARLGHGLEGTRYVGSKTELQLVAEFAARLGLWWREVLRVEVGD